MPHSWDLVVLTAYPSTSSSSDLRLTSILGPDDDKGHHAQTHSSRSARARHPESLHWSAANSWVYLPIFQRPLSCAEADETAQARLITSITTVEGPTRG